MTFDCLAKKTDVGGIDAIILGVDKSKGARGGGFTFLKSALLATINRDALPQECKPFRPDTPIFMNVGSLYISYQYDPAHTNFTAGLQLHGYSSGRWLTKSFTKLAPGALLTQIDLLPPEQRGAMHGLLITADRYDPRLGVSELLSKGKISHHHLARFGASAPSAKLDRT